MSNMRLKTSSGRINSDDGRAGLQCFDRSTVSANVDLDYDVQAVEVRVVNSDGSAGTTVPTKEEIVAALLAQLNPTNIADAVWQKTLP